jgi:diguanylate cyclase (GGDEF)-like protein
MIDGDVLERVTPADEGTADYESIMRPLLYFQHNIDLKYIYVIHDQGNGNFTFGLDPSDDPGEFGSPIVYTDALYKASLGTPAADDKFYEDAWGKFYSAYSPVFNSKGKVAGIIAVDFSAEWYEKQLATLTRTTLIVALLSLLAGAIIVITIISRSQRKINSLQGQLNTLASTLMEEMGTEEKKPSLPEKTENTTSIDTLGKQIQSMQNELKSQIAQVHGQAYLDGLTGVKSKHAYLEAAKAMDEQMASNTCPQFAVVVCDLNGLKKINDTLGHQAGDEYIRRACKMICDIFSHSPVYRIGGDEFAVILTGRDYDSREILMHELHRQSAEHIMTHEAIVSGGIGEFISEQDHSVNDVFKRADQAMYAEKMNLKHLGAATREEEQDQSDSDLGFEDILAANIRRHILIADDIETNREILEDLLQEDYDILTASDGIETLEILRNQKDEIALLILDLYMPRLSGREVLAEMQVDPELMHIPVVVLTIDQEAELECLKLGAMDFIPKPFPDIEIVKARISKCIELSENRDLIRHTQRDKLTGLFNIDYFLRYVALFDQQYGDETLDALVCDINGFHVVNDLYGRQYGDLVLRSVGMNLRKLARRAGGIGCRKGSDTFLLYCPHRDDYETLLRKFVTDLYLDKDTADRIKLRFGVFPNAGQESNVEERFACAMSAANSIKDDPQKLCGYYRL